MGKVNLGLDDRSARLIHGKDVWSHIRNLLSGSRRIAAAIGYVGADADAYLPMRGPGTIVVNAGDEALTTGSTDPNVLLRWTRRGVRVYSLPSLHAKVILVEGDPSFVLVGSANVSWSSANRLDEAVLLADERETVDEMSAAIAAWQLEAGEPLTQEWLQEAVRRAQPAPPRPQPEHDPQRSGGSRPSGFEKLATAVPQSVDSDSFPDPEHAAPEFEPAIAEPKPVMPDLEAMAPDVEAVAPDVEAAAPDVGAVTPDVEPVTPELEPVAAELDPLASHREPQTTQHAQPTDEEPASDDSADLGQSRSESDTGEYSEPEAPLPAVVWPRPKYIYLALLTRDGRASDNAQEQLEKLRGEFRAADASGELDVQMFWSDQPSRAGKPQPTYRAGWHVVPISVPASGRPAVLSAVDSPGRVLHSFTDYLVNPARTYYYLLAHSAGRSITFRRLRETLATLNEKPSYDHAYMMQHKVTAILELWPEIGYTD
ncbi:MAG: phospholipase D-like domain-containing protein [Nakamurella sp.]